MRLLTLTALLLLCALALFACDKPEQAIKMEMGDFTLHDIAGVEVSLKSFRGKVVLLEFWATWCPPCRQAVPELKQLHENMKDEEFVLLAIAVKDRLSKIRRFVEEHGIEYTVLLDNKGVDDIYKAYTIPTSILLDKEGNVALTHRGFAPGMFKDMEKDIRELL
ncbi:MAG: TlpA family protein disulfide reductase [Thermodesulfovibrionales bacterium]|nr:TlpA family protein disulfide reductase [Thermodesulfovibrionales bacterium]